MVTWRLDIGPIESLVVHRPVMFNEEGCVSGGPQPSTRTVANTPQQSQPRSFALRRHELAIGSPHQIGWRNISCARQGELLGGCLKAGFIATRIGIWIILVASIWSPAARSQVYSGAGNAHEVFVGTETENYFRYLD